MMQDERQMDVSSAPPPPPAPVTAVAPTALPRRNRGVGAANVVLLLLIVAIAFAGGMLFDRRVVAPAGIGRSGSGPGAGGDDWRVFWQAYDTIRQQYFDREVVADREVMTQGAIRGMVDALGDIGHTRYLTQREYKSQEEALAGEFEGIGAEVGVRDGRLQIVAPIGGSPAERAGVKPGDIILKVDGEDVEGQTQEEIIRKIRGKAGTPVTILFARPRENNPALEITITRGRIPQTPISSYTLPESHIALIRLTQFSRNATDDLKAAIKSARDAGARGIVIDVRNNPGGLLNQAISVTSQFLKEGTPIVQQKGTRGSDTYKAEAAGTALDLPLAVLTNNGSASAAEIFAGAIKASGRGTVIGERTYGTGTVLNIFQLDDGSAILLGTAEWLTPDGRSLRRSRTQTGGVEPEVAVPLPAGATLLTPREAQELAESEVFQTSDAQLQRALQTLRGTITASAPAGTR